MQGDGGQLGGNAPQMSRLVDALSARPPDHAVLYGAVRDYVRDMAAAGQPITSAIVGLKTALRRATHGDQAQFEALAQRAVTWCIEEYYREGRRADADR
jgi:hypothetical protein